MTATTHSYGEANGDIWALKLDVLGNVLWTQTYNRGYGGYEKGAEGHQLNDGGYIFVGSSYGIIFSNLISDDVFIVRTNTSGNVLWVKTYGGQADDGGDSIKELLDGFICVGYTKSFGAGGSDVYLIRTDASGNTGNTIK